MAEVFDTVSFTVKSGETLTGKVSAVVQTECGPGSLRTIYEVRVNPANEEPEYEVDGDTMEGRKFLVTYLD
jgi:hypothetical protein